jgi:hypothetical protein
MVSIDYTNHNLEGFSKVLIAAGVSEQTVAKFCNIFTAAEPDHGLIRDHALPPHYPSLLSTNDLLDGHGSCSYIQKRVIIVALTYAGIRRSTMTADQLLSKARQGETSSV